MNRLQAAGFDGLEKLLVVLLVLVGVAFGKAGDRLVAGGLHQSLSLDDALAVLVELTGGQVRLQHGHGCFFDLKEQRVVLVAALEQDIALSCAAAMTGQPRTTRSQFVRAERAD